MYLGNFKASVSQHGSGRVATLLKSACKLHGCTVVAATYKLTRYVEGVGAAFPAGDFPNAVVGLAEKYRAMYVASDLNEGFSVPTAKAKQRPFLRAVLGLYWHINRDHVALEQEALASGRWVVAPPRDAALDDFVLDDALAANADDALAADADDALADDADDALEDEPAPSPASSEPKVWSRRSFALLPVNSLRRHVRIDKDVFARQVYRRLHKMNVVGIEADASSRCSFATRPSRRRQRRGARRGTRPPARGAGTSASCAPPTRAGGSGSRSRPTGRQ